LNRREFAKHSLTAAAPALFATGALPGLAAETTADKTAGKSLKVVCVGGHPDDPESGCAGTLARYSAASHAVTVVYLTRGERGIRGKSLDEAAAIRTAECAAACAIMGAKAAYAGQIDGETELNATRVAEMLKLLEAEAPDVVITHWPIDTHMDHQIAGLLTMRACMSLPRKPHLYFFEVNTGSQSHGFVPNTYVDVTAVLEKKKSALVAHISQNGEKVWTDHHEIIATYRGREAGVKAAEAFFHLARGSRLSILPGL
jgi:LmbE family N-acetylglucosaminyl deacetylase